MKRIATYAVFGLIFVFASVTATFAMEKDPPVQHRTGFVDLNGDGFNDNAPDFDNDGIPNGQDPDYVRPQNGKGQAKGWAFGRGGRRNFQGKGNAFIDENGDGICDRYEERGSLGRRGMNGKGQGFCGRAGGPGFRNNAKSGGKGRQG